jgi:hypothetical protein
MQMLLMNYTNTHTPTNETFNEQILVVSQKVGEALIAKWNEQSRNLMNNKWSYVLTSFALVDDEDKRYKGMGRWMSETLYSHPEGISFQG